MFNFCNKKSHVSQGERPVLGMALRPHRSLTFVSKMMTVFIVCLLVPTSAWGAPAEPQAFLPQGISKVAFGTAFNNGTDCNIAEPMPEPITYPAGTTQLAIQVVFTPGKHSYHAEINPGFGGGIPIVSRSCNRYVICMGQVCQTQFGVTISRADGQPLSPNHYTFSFSLDGGVPMTVPFVISGADPPMIARQPANQTITSRQSATLNVTATGVGALTYQWYQGLSGDVSTPVAGATSSTFATPGLTGNTNFWVRVSDAQGRSIDSATAMITVVTGFNISVPNSASTDVPFAVKVTAHDANNVIATGYQGTVNFASSDNQATLPSSYTFVNTDTGVHTFMVTLKTAGNQSLTVNDANVAIVTGSTELQVGANQPGVQEVYLPLINR